MHDQKKTNKTGADKTHRKMTKDQLAHDEQPEYPDTLAQTNKPPDKIVITPEIAALFRQGIKRFYEHSAEISLKEAYRLTLQHYFQVSHELNDGVQISLLPPVEQLPTFRQFQRWYKRHALSRQTFPQSGGKYHSRGSSHGRLDNSMKSSFGPGSLYQIDAVASDIQVASSLDPSRIIGRPTIYLIWDTFSQMIVGINIGWERPNWPGVILALENATEEKVSFCQHYGVTITEAAWPAHHLPQALLIDEPRKFEGDFEVILGYLAVSLGIGIDNTFPFPDGWSTAIRRRYYPPATKFISSLLTSLQESFQQGGLGGLTLGQVRRLIIHTVLQYNLELLMVRYPLDESMIADQVEPYPIHLWNWGVQNRSGHLRTMDPQMLRKMLLPKGEALVTNREVLFQGLSYRCSLPLDELLFTSMRAGKQQRVPVNYNPQLVDVIYLQLDGGQQLVPCFLVEQERHLARCAWQEFQHTFEAQQQENRFIPLKEPPERRQAQGSGEIT